MRIAHLRRQQRHQLVGGRILEQIGEGRQLAALGGGQPLQLHPGHGEHIDPGIHQGLRGSRQEHLGGQAGQGLEIEVGLLQAEGQVQGWGDLAQGAGGILRPVFKRPDHHPPMGGGGGQGRQHEMVDQAIAHQQVADQIAQGLLLQGHAAAHRERWQGGLQAHRLGLAIKHHLAAQGMVLQLEQHLPGEHLGPERTQSFLPRVQ